MWTSTAGSASCCRWWAACSWCSSIAAPPRSNDGPRADLDRWRLSVAAFLIDSFVTGDPTLGGAAYTLFQLEDLARLAVPLCFLWGLLRSNLDRGRVGDLIERLSGTSRRAGSATRWRTCFTIPDLRLAFPSRIAVDEAGAEVPAPERIVLGLVAHRVDGRTLAVIGHDPAIDGRLIAAVGAATAMALKNARLHAEVREQLEEVRASRARIVGSADAERRRIERDLHDGAQQRLLTLSFRLRAAMKRSRDVDPALREDLAEPTVSCGTRSRSPNLARGIHPRS